MPKRREVTAAKLKRFVEKMNREPPGVEQTDAVIAEVAFECKFDALDLGAFEASGERNVWSGPWGSLIEDRTQPASARWSFQPATPGDDE